MDADEVAPKPRLEADAETVALKPGRQVRGIVRNAVIADDREEATLEREKLHGAGSARYVICYHVRLKLPPAVTRLAEYASGCGERACALHFFGHYGFQNQFTRFCRRRRH